MQSAEEDIRGGTTMLSSDKLSASTITNHKRLKECLSQPQPHFPLSQNKILSEFLIWAQGDSS